MSNYPNPINLSATQTLNNSRSLFNAFHSASKTAIDNHVSGTADLHDASHITYTGEVTGASYVHSALDTLDTRIDNIVADTSASTAEVIDARNSINGESNAVLKDRLDKIENQAGQITNITSDSTLTLSQRGIINVSSASADITLTLPSSATTHIEYTIKKGFTANFTVTVTATATQTIDGLTSNITLNLQYDTLTLLSNGSNWIIPNADLKSEVLGGGYFINGNFDIWQRGTSFTNLISGDYSADRIQFTYSGGSSSGTFDTSRQSFTRTSPEVSGGMFYLRHNQTVIGNRTGVVYSQNIEQLPKFAHGKTFVQSIWIRSSVTISANLSYITNFGTGGSPSAIQANQKIFTIPNDNTWHKYYHTTTFDYSGKTFGTNDDPYIYVRIGGLEEINQNICTFDIAQWKLELGNYPTNFVPKTFNEELRNCQRYYEKSYDISSVAGTANTTAPTQIYVGGTKINSVDFKTRKRTTPTVTLYSTDGTSGAIYNVSTTANITASATNIGESFFTIQFTASQTLGDVISYHWIADAEI